LGGVTVKKIIIAIVLVVVIAMLSVTGCSNPASSPEANKVTVSFTELKVNLLGEISSFQVDNEGALLNTVEVSSPDGSIGIVLEKGTAVSDNEGKPLESFSVQVESKPFAMPVGIQFVSPVYKLEPEGAEIEPSYNITFSYDGTELPAEAEESDLLVGYNDGNDWYGVRYKKVNTEEKSVTTRINETGYLAIIAVEESSSPGLETPATSGGVGELAPDFKLLDLEGKMVSLSDFDGRPVLLNFWATWCGPCRMEMPFIQQVYEDKKWSDAGLAILAIDLGESAEKVKNFIDSNSYTFPVLLDRNGSVAQKYNAGTFIPTSLLIDKYGIIKGVKIGPFTSKASLEKALNKIVP